MKTILDLCAGTGAWSAPYVAAGNYRVHRISLPEYDVTKVDIDDRYITFWRAQQESVEQLEFSTRIPLVQIHGIMAAPPCREFSLANTRQTYALRPNWQEGLVAVQACERIIRAVMCKGYLKWWALENPMGHLRKFLGIPRFTFESWWYDADVAWSKKTDLWGYFEKPRRSIEEKPARLSNEQRDRYRHQPGWYTPEAPEPYRHMGLDRAAIRAITPSGFAQAFYKANK